MNDTIVALASGGLAKSAVAVIRMSGPRVRFVFETVAKRIPPARMMHLTNLISCDGDLLDQALVVFFPSPHSFSGEDCAEFHIHGGKAVIARVMSALLDFDNVRLAHPGEFTQRAFHNGKLNLAQVEGLADLIDAETQAQSQQALRQLEGALGEKVKIWRQSLISALTYLEAHLDFSDEGDVPQNVYEDIRSEISRLCIDLQMHVSTSHFNEKIREGFVVTLLGPPNAGKSSLINALAKRDVAIVSPYAGTTRDALEVYCDLEGLPVTFIDTAGLRKTDDPVELMGVAKSRLKASQADIQIWLSPADDPTLPDEACDPNKLMIFESKSDLNHDYHSSDETPLKFTIHDAKSIDSFAKLITNRLKNFAAPEVGLLTRERHRIACKECLDILQRFQSNLGDQYDELCAEDLRLAMRKLGSLIGIVDVEDVLDQLFSSFCIGK
jgi:tRNA modification GTPase